MSGTGFFGTGIDELRTQVFLVQELTNVEAVDAVRLKMNKSTAVQVVTHRGSASARSVNGLGRGSNGKVWIGTRYL